MKLNSGVRNRFRIPRNLDALLIYGIPVFLGIISMSRHLPDRNFDRRNAYDYNVWAFLENRYSQDWMPSGLGSFLNPIVNVPAYLIGLMPVVFSFFYGIAFMLIYLKFILMIMDLIDDDGILQKRNHRIAFAILSSASPLFLSELGTAMSGYTSSVFVVAGIYFIVKGAKQGSSQSYFLSGLLIGLSIHFKLVNAITLIAILPFFIVVKTRKFLTLAYFALGGIVSLLIFLPWYIFVYIKFQSPVFPLFNEFFKSSFYPKVNFKDQRWTLDTPEKFLQLLSGLWARINTEIPAFDLRIFLISSLLILLVANSKVILPRLLKDRIEFALLLWFLLFSILWAETSFIARYFMPGELMIGVMLFIIFKHLFEKSIFGQNGILILSLIVVSVMHVPNWNTWQEQFLDANTKISKIDKRWQFPQEITIPPKSQILTLGEPISYVFKFFPKNSRFINIGWPKYNTGVEIPPPLNVIDSINRVSSKNLFLTVLPLKTPEGLQLANEYLLPYKLQVVIPSCRLFRTSSEEFSLCSLEKF